MPIGEPILDALSSVMPGVFSERQPEVYSPDIALGNSETSKTPPVVASPKRQPERRRVIFNHPKYKDEMEGVIWDENLHGIATVLITDTPASMKRNLVGTTIEIERSNLIFAHMLTTSADFFGETPGVL